MRYIKKAMKSAESNSQDARKVVERMLEEIREGREDKVKENLTIGTKSSF